MKVGACRVTGGGRGIGGLNRFRFHALICDLFELEYSYSEQSFPVRIETPISILVHVCCRRPRLHARLKFHAHSKKYFIEHSYSE